MRRHNLDSASVTTKGQLVIPAKIRRRFGIKTGTRIHFIERQGEIVMQPVTHESIRGLCGILKSETSVTKELLAERKLDREREEQKLARFRPR